MKSLKQAYLIVDREWFIQFLFQRTCFMIVIFFLATWAFCKFLSLFIRFAANFGPKSELQYYGWPLFYYNSSSSWSKFNPRFFHEQEKIKFNYHLHAV